MSFLDIEETETQSYVILSVPPFFKYNFRYDIEAGKNEITPLP